MGSFWGHGGWTGARGGGGRGGGGRKDRRREGARGNNDTDIARIRIIPKRVVTQNLPSERNHNRPQSVCPANVAEIRGGKSSSYSPERELPSANHTALMVSWGPFGVMESFGGHGVLWGVIRGRGMRSRFVELVPCGNTAEHTTIRKHRFVTLLAVDVLCWIYLRGRLGHLVGVITHARAHFS